jgi:hypothetical protein
MLRGQKHGRRGEAAACMSVASLAAFLPLTWSLARFQSHRPAPVPTRRQKIYTTDRATTQNTHRVPYLFSGSSPLSFSAPLPPACLPSRLPHPPGRLFQLSSPSTAASPLLLPSPTRLAGIPGQNARAEAPAPFAVVQTTRPRGGQRDGCFHSRRRPGRGRRNPTGTGRRRRQSGDRPAAAARRR